MSTSPVVIRKFEANREILEANGHTVEDFQSLKDIVTRLNELEGEKHDEESGQQENQSNYSDSSSGTERNDSEYLGLPTIDSTWSDRNGRRQTRVQAQVFDAAYANVRVKVGDKVLTIGGINLQTLVDPINEGASYKQARAILLKILEADKQDKVTFDVELNVTGANSTKATEEIDAFIEAL